jgi:hypothetical protein
MNAANHPISESKIKQGLELCQAMFQKKGLDLDALANIMARSINPNDFDSPRHFLECCREHMRRGRYMPVLSDLLALANEARTASFEVAWVKLHSWAITAAQRDSWDALVSDLPDEAVTAFRQIGGAGVIQSASVYELGQLKAAFLKACSDENLRYRATVVSYQPAPQPAPEELIPIASLAAAAARLRMGSISTPKATPVAADPKKLISASVTAQIEADLIGDRR